MSSHHSIQSLLNTRLASISPGIPIKYENLDFTPPQKSDKVIPQSFTFRYNPRTMQAGDQYLVVIDGEQFSSTGSTVAAALLALSKKISGSVFNQSSLTLKILGPSSGMPFTASVMVLDSDSFIVSDAMKDPQYEFDPGFIGNAYLEAYLMEGTSYAAGVGDDAPNAHVGVFQVNVKFPSGTGWGLAKTMAGVVCSLFRRGTILEEGQTRVTLRTASQGTAVQTPQWYVVPVSVFYIAYSPND